MRYLKIVFTLLLITKLAVANAQGTSKDQFVQIKTNVGTMIFQLSAEAPKHVANFLKLAKKGYFNTYDFNRVLKGFVAQGGETDSAYAAMEKNGVVLDRIPAEFSAKLFHQRGALAAGRDDNPAKSSFLGQIYIVDGRKYTDTQLDALEKRMGNGFKFTAEQRKTYKEFGGAPNLDQNYTVFGQLVKGIGIFDQLMNQKANKAGKPEVRISLTVELLSKNKAKSLLTNN